MDRVELAILMDCYGGMLTQRQRSLLEQSIDEDFSLSEIAEREGISRQGVRDAIMKAERQLYAADRAIGLKEKLRKLNEALDETETKVDALECGESEKRELYDCICRLRQISEE